VLPVEGPSNTESVWRQITATGILSLPSAFLNPERGAVVMDGTLFVLEVRRGREYRFYEIAAGWPPGDPTVLRVGRVAEILTRAYTWR
jgi:hypothetical protein